MTEIWRFNDFQNGGRPPCWILKIWDPLLISATVEGSNFKFGTQLGFGTSLPKKQRLGPKMAGAWAREASEKIWDPYLFLQPTEKLVHNRFTLPNTSLGEYHSPPHYDDDATVYSTCHQKLTGTQISLPNGIKQKISVEKD